MPICPNLGHHLILSDVKENAVLGTDMHSAPTEVIALENTLNGTIFPQDEIVAIAEFGHSQGIKMHLDGARIWHVVAETGTPMDELCAPFDSVSLCFSKGLGRTIYPFHEVILTFTPSLFCRRTRWLVSGWDQGIHQES